MKKNISKIALISALTFAPMAMANETPKSSDHRFFIGGFAGGSKTLDNSFIDKETKTKFTFKHPSPTYGALVGYQITDDIAIDFSYMEKSNYKAVLTLDPTLGDYKSKTKASAKSFMLNLTYNMNDVGGFTPFFKIGAGIEQIKLKQTSINTVFLEGTEAEQFAFPGLLMQTARHTSNCLAMEVGLGAKKNITEDFALNITGTLHIAKDAKLKALAADKDETKAALDGRLRALQYGTSSTLPSISDVVYKKKTVKKTFGVGEILVGFTYKLPI